MAADVAPRLLDNSELTGDDFKSLLADASGAFPELLDALLDHVVAEFEVCGIGNEQLDGFAAYRTDAQGILLKYIGVRTSARKMGHGRALVNAIRQLHPALPMRAQTDDGGVGFYRSLGAEVRQAPPNPRRPEDVVYDCTFWPAEPH